MFGGHFRAVWRYLRTLWGHLGASGDIVGLFGVFEDTLGTFRGVWGHCRAIWGIQGYFGDI